MPEPERGQATPLVLVVVVLVALLAGGIARVGAAVTVRASVQAAADAAALAGATAGTAAAADVADANHVRLVGYWVDGDDVVVEVDRNGATARARARWVPAPIP